MSIRLIKKLILRIFVVLDAFIPIFPKDSLYQFKFSTKELRPLPINDRALGMQYWCDYGQYGFVSRYSKYLGSQTIGLLYNNEVSWQLEKHEHLEDDKLICPRWYGKRLLLLRKEINSFKIYDFETRRIVGEVEESWFDIFDWKGKKYVISGDRIYAITQSSGLRFQLKFHCSISIDFNFGEGSICEFEDKLLLAIRMHGKGNSAIGSSIMMLQSSDLLTWELLGEAFSKSKYPQYSMSGVGFPTLRVVGKELTLFFAGYWGRHFLSLHTKRFWENKNI